MSHDVGALDRQKNVWWSLALALLCKICLWRRTWPLGFSRAADDLRRSNKPDTCEVLKRRGAGLFVANAKWQVLFSVVILLTCYLYTRYSNNSKERQQFAALPCLWPWVHKRRPLRRACGPILACRIKHANVLSQILSAINKYAAKRDSIP
jgi:hypothetical protein